MANQHKMIYLAKEKRLRWLLDPTSHKTKSPHGFLPSKVAFFWDYHVQWFCEGSWGQAKEVKRTSITCHFHVRFKDVQPNRTGGASNFGALRKSPVFPCLYRGGLAS